MAVVGCGMALGWATPRAWALVVLLEEQVFLLQKVSVEALDGGDATAADAHWAQRAEASPTGRSDTLLSWQGSADPSQDPHVEGTLIFFTDSDEPCVP